LPDTDALGLAHEIRDREGRIGQKAAIAIIATAGCAAADHAGVTAWLLPPLSADHLYECVEQPGRARSNTALAV